MALTQISTQGIKDGTITGSDLATNIDLVDNQRLRLGNGQDLLIFHDGTNSSIQNGTGTLRLRGDSIKLNNNAASENYLVATANGGVELFYDNTKRLETTSIGVTVTGAINASSNVTLSGGSFSTPGNLDLGDSSGTASGRVLLGAGDDLQIYHNGTHSFMENSTGILAIRSDSFQITDKSNNHAMITATADGAVELYHDNSKKFETTSTGANVTSANDAVLKVTTTGTASTDDARIELITQESTFTIQNDRSLGTDGVLTISAGSEAGIYVFKDGVVQLYNDGSKKFETSSTGVTVTGTLVSNGINANGAAIFNEAGADVDFRVEGDAQANLIKVDAGNDRVGIGESDPSTVFQVTQFNHAFADSTSSLATVPTKSVARLRGSNNSSASLFIGNESNAAKCYLQGSNDTGNSSIDILLNPFGANVGIGTTSPVTKLHINGGTYAAPTGGNDGFTQLVVSNQAAGQGAGIGLLGAGNMVTFIHFGDSDDANVGAIVYNNVVDAMQFYVNASQRMHIDSSGNVGLGVGAVSNARFRIKGANNNTSAFDDGLMVTSNNETVYKKYSWMGIETKGGLSFHETNSGSLVETMRISTSGNIGIGTTATNERLNIHTASSLKAQMQFTNTTTGTGGGDGFVLGITGGEEVVFANQENTDMSFSTNNTERMRVLAGGGLTFNGDTAAANALDDYEEGTWTPTASNFTIAQNYSGNYTRIGNVVYIQMYIVASGGTGISAVSIGGLPYTVKAGNYYSYAAGRIGGSASQGYDKVFEFINSSTNVQPKVADGAINEGMISGQHLIMSGFYHVA